MQKIIGAYFKECEDKGKPVTIEGLAVALDCDRKTILNYETKEGYEEFFPTIKRAKARVLASLMEMGLAGKHNSAVAIFGLKNNFGFKDRQDHEITGKDGSPLISTVSVKVVRSKEEINGSSDNSGR